MSEITKKKLLIVDDEERILESIHKQLKNENYDIELELDPLKAVDKAEENNYDLIICDVRMKEIDGIELIKRVKNFHKDMRVIVLTGFVNEQIVRDIENLNCKDFLIKPVRKKILLNAVKKALK